MRAFISSLKSAIMGKKDDRPDRDQRLRSFVHEMDKKLLHLEVAYSKWHKGFLDKNKFIEILDRVVGQMNQEFSSEAQHSPQLMNLRDKSGDLFIEKINRLQLLSYSLKDAKNDEEKFQAVSTEINEWVNDDEATPKNLMLEKARSQLKQFKGFDEAMHEAIQMVRAERENELLNYELEIQASFPDRVLSKILFKEDFVKWRTFFVNILRNGCDAVVAQIEREPELQSERRIINVILEKNDKGTDIIIRDRGIGMDEEIKTKIFQTGFSTKKKVRSERGIGLNQDIWEIINKYGQLTIDSQPNVGTTFHIHIN